MLRLNASVQRRHDAFSEDLGCGIITIKYFIAPLTLT